MSRSRRRDISLANRTDRGVLDEGIDEQRVVRSVHHVLGFFHKGSSGLLLSFMVWLRKRWGREGMSIEDKGN